MDLCAQTACAQAPGLQLFLRAPALC
jgi:hypothetical protein